MKVGVVGEIYVKFSPLGNNNLEQFLLSEGCEVVVPGLTDFIIFKIFNRVTDIELYGGSRIKYLACKALMNYVVRRQSAVIDIVGKSRFRAPTHFETIHRSVHDYLGDGNKMGEGWLLTGEMLELIHEGIPNIVCTQPFGCLPNHIVGKGMIRPLKDDYPDSNIVAIDYDPSATAINQENRIKLMLANARQKLRQEKGKATAAPEQKKRCRRCIKTTAGRASGTFRRFRPAITRRNNAQWPAAIAHFQREKYLCKGERKNMAIERVQAYFRALHMEERIRVLEASSATVELAAQALQCAPERIAKTLSFLVQDDPVLIVAAGDGRIDNQKYKAQFGTKAKMLTPEQAETMVGHAVGGVCPFAVNEGVKVYLDASLKRFETVFPPAAAPIPPLN